MFRIERYGEDANLVKPRDEEFAKGGILDPECDAHGGYRICVRLIGCHDIAALRREDGADEVG